MILSSGGKKPKIHSTAYVAPTATISGDVTIDAGCAILHGAVLVAEGAPLTIGKDCVVMENAVIKSSGGTATKFPVTIGSKCIIGPHAYIVGATIGAGCFIATSVRVFNGAVMAEGSGAAIGAIIHVNASLPKNVSVPMQHIAYGSPAKIVSPDKAPEAARDLQFYENVFNIAGGEGARAKAAETYASFLRKTHAKDSPQATHENVAPGGTRRGEPNMLTAPVEADTVVDVMMLELQEMEAIRRESQAKKNKK